VLLNPIAMNSLLHLFVHELVQQPILELHPSLGDESLFFLIPLPFCAHLNG